VPAEPNWCHSTESTSDQSASGQQASGTSLGFPGSG
jgi:hypothetical protein